MTAFCTQCLKSKPLEDFYKSQLKNELTALVCKKCNTSNSRKSQLKSKYGITDEDYLCMFLQQECKCAICGNVQKTRKLAVDHDHKTGKVRALLCHNCNVLLGHAKDDIEILKKAISYLKEHNEH